MIIAQGEKLTKQIKETCLGYLYITENGVSVGLDGGNMLLSFPDGRAESLPKEVVDSILIFGRSQLTTPAIQYCLNRGINVSFFSMTGQYMGSLIPEAGVDVSRLRKQISLTQDEEVCLSVAKKIVDAKIGNQLVLVRRYLRESGLLLEDRVQAIKLTQKKVLQAKSIQEVMGYEGNASRTYFSILSSVVSDEFRFEGRSRRPAKDPFNAMLNIGYSMLYHEMIGVISNRSLCSYAGFMHQDKTGHATLASDMMEEWRAIIVDSTVMSLIMGNEITKQHFELDETECRITPEGLRIFIAKMEHKMYTENQYITEIGKPIDYRKAIYHQIQNLVWMIENQDVSFYNPIRIR